MEASSRPRVAACRHRRLRRRRDPDVLRLDDRQADRARQRPRRGDREDARGAERVRDPRHREQHPVPGGAARASEFVAGDFNTGFIAEHYPKGFRPGHGAARRPDFLRRAGGRGQPRATRSARPASAASCRGTSCRSARTSSSSRTDADGARRPDAGTRARWTARRIDVDDRRPRLSRSASRAPLRDIVHARQRATASRSRRRSSG